GDVSRRAGRPGVVDRREELRRRRRDDRRGDACCEREFEKRHCCSAFGAGPGATVICGFSLRKLFSPMPWTFISSSIFLNGPLLFRYSTIRSAVLGPMPGSAASSIADAVLRLIREAGVAAGVVAGFAPALAGGAGAGFASDRDVCAQMGLARRT